MLNCPTKRPSIRTPKIRPVPSRWSRSARRMYWEKVGICSSVSGGRVASHGRSQCPSARRTASRSRCSWPSTGRMTSSRGFGPPAGSGRKNPRPTGSVTRSVSISISRPHTHVERRSRRHLIRGPGTARCPPRARSSRPRGQRPARWSPRARRAATRPGSP